MGRRAGYQPEGARSSSGGTGQSMRRGSITTLDLGDRHDLDRLDPPGRSPTPAAPPRRTGGAGRRRPTSTTSHDGTRRRRLAAAISSPVPGGARNRSGPAAPASTERGRRRLVAVEVQGPRVVGDDQVVAPPVQLVGSGPSRPATSGTTATTAPSGRSRLSVVAADSPPRSSRDRPRLGPHVPAVSRRAHAHHRAPADGWRSSSRRHDGEQPGQVAAERPQHRGGLGGQQRLVDLSGPGDGAQPLDRMHPIDAIADRPDAVARRSRGPASRSCRYEHHEQQHRS